MSCSYCLSGGKQGRKKRSLQPVPVIHSILQTTWNEVFLRQIHPCSCQTTMRIGKLVLALQGLWCLHSVFSHSRDPTLKSSWLHSLHWKENRLYCHKMSCIDFPVALWFAVYCVILCWFFLDVRACRTLIHWKLDSGQGNKWSIFGADLDPVMGLQMFESIS